MAYSEKVVEHYENPRNVGSFEKGDDTVGTGMVGALSAQRRVPPHDSIDHDHVHDHDHDHD